VSKCRLNVARSRSLSERSARDSASRTFILSCAISVIIPPAIPPTNTVMRAANPTDYSSRLNWGPRVDKKPVTHQKHELPDPTPSETLELLFVASYLMRLLELSKP
jgi:hypothetical protein